MPKGSQGSMLTSQPDIAHTWYKYMLMVHSTGDTHDSAVLHWAGAVVVQLTDLTYLCLR